MEYAELLKRLTVDCKDDGKQFRKKDRIHEIKALLENSGYELLGEGSLSLLYGKPMEEEILTGRLFHPMLIAFIKIVLPKTKTNFAGRARSTIVRPMLP